MSSYQKERELFLTRFVADVTAAPRNTGVYQMRVSETFYKSALALLENDLARRGFYRRETGGGCTAYVRNSGGEIVEEFITLASDACVLAQAMAEQWSEFVIHNRK